MKLHPTGSSFEDVVLTAKPAFSKRSWKYVLGLALPWLLLAGQRCMTRLALLAGPRRSLSAYYRFLSHGKWRLHVLFRCLFNLIVETFPAPTLTLVIDDTLCPKWGKGIFGTASHFDHAARPRAGFIWGHNWLVVAVVVQMGGRAWVAVPCWIELYRPEKICRKGEFRTKLELAGAALRVIRTWFPGPILVLADGAYNNSGLVPALRKLEMHLVSRLRSDARLRSIEIPIRPKSKRGRKPKYGPRLPSLAALARQTRAFVPIAVDIYGKHVHLLVREFVAYWPALGCQIKVVITRDPSNPKRVAFLSTTDLRMAACEVVVHFSARWPIEQLFSVLKHSLGFDSTEVRTRNSVIRHAALTMALATWVEVWAKRSSRRLSAQSFARKLSALREQTVASLIFASGPRTRRSARIAKGICQLFSTATRAA